MILTILILVGRITLRNIYYVNNCFGLLNTLQSFTILVLYSYRAIAHLPSTKSNADKLGVQISRFAFIPQTSR